MARSSAPRAWDPAVYLAFAAERVRPAMDLMSRIKQASPERIVDLGCGAGNVTRLLAERWPSARITGVDQSPAMLAEARAADNSIRWVAGDIAAWAPPKPLDLIFSNAALHWLDAHETLFPRLLRYLKRDGELAVQMPRNHHAPSHLAIAEIAERGPWKDSLARLLAGPPVHDPDVYIDRLLPLTTSIDVWETTYWHVLDGDNPVVEWMKGTALKPFIEALPEDHRKAFLAAYANRMTEAYPASAEGRTLFPFRRLFIVARR